jgi:hypothetical protein
MLKMAKDVACGKETKYECLESKVFDSYLKLSVSEKVTESLFGTDEYSDLCRFTRNAYALFVKEPELLLKTLNEDDAYPNPFNASQYGKPELKVSMRKALKAVSDFMRFIWDISIEGNPCNNDINIKEGTKIPKKYKSILHNVGIAAEDDIVTSKEYPGMFKALIRLSCDENGFERFIRCTYDDYNSCKDIFGAIINDGKLFNDLINEVEKRGYIYKANLNASEVKSFEGMKVAWTKSVDGSDTPNNISMYDRNNYGIFFNYSVIFKDQLLLFLKIQNVRKVLEMFDTLDEKLRGFIITTHAHYHGCGYCTQRNKNRVAALKPHMISLEYNGKIHALCPVLDYVYSYCWNHIDEKLVDGIMLYLELQEKIHET